MALVRRGAPVTQDLLDATAAAKRRTNLGDSEYGVPTGSLPVTGAAPVPGVTDPSEISAERNRQINGTPPRRKMPRSHITD
jgi:hypothetical protein